MAARTKAKRAAKPSAKQSADKSVKKAFPLIGRSDLSRLLEQVAIFQNRASTASGSMRELVGEYVKKKHLHAGAFSLTNRLYRMGNRDPEALWRFLAHFDDMRAKAGLDRIAKVQGQLLPAISDEQEPAEAQDETERENVVAYPQPREVEERAGDAA